MSQEEKHVHSVPDREESNYSKELKCSECGKTTGQMWTDTNDVDPTTRMSQQPYGKSTMYCNMCQMYVKPTQWDGRETCPYHQDMRMTEEGPVFAYDEFNQEGEEW